MGKQIKEAFANYGTWVAMFALIGFIIIQFVPGFDQVAWAEFVSLFLGLVVALGIVSNPKDGEWFVDEEDEKEQ